MKITFIIKAITEWFTESAVAVKHNPDDWVTTRELIEDFIALGFTHDGQPIGNFDQNKRRNFLTLLDNHLVFFTNGKLFKTKLKPYPPTPNLRLQLLDEPSYRLSKFGEWLSDREVFLQRGYIGAMFIVHQVTAYLKQYKWLFSIITFIATTVGALKSIHASIVSMYVALLCFIVAGIMKAIFGNHST